MKARLALTLGFPGLLLVSGCNLAPTYHQPTQAIQNSYPADTGSRNVAAAAKVANLGWADFYTDPRLKALVELALHNNRDIAAQAAAVTVSRGQYEIQNASLFPIISTGGRDCSSVRPIRRVSPSRRVWAPTSPRCACIRHPSDFRPMRSICGGASGT